MNSICVASSAEVPVASSPIETDKMSKLDRISPLKIVWITVAVVGISRSTGLDATLDGRICL